MLHDRASRIPNWASWRRVTQAALSDGVCRKGQQGWVRASPARVSSDFHKAASLPALSKAVCVFVRVWAFVRVRACVLVWKQRQIMMKPKNVKKGYDAFFAECAGCRFKLTPERAWKRSADEMYQSLAGRTAHSGYLSAKSSGLLAATITPCDDSDSNASASCQPCLAGSAIVSSSSVFYHDTGRRC